MQKKQDPRIEFKIRLQSLSKVGYKVLRIRLNFNPSIIVIEEMRVLFLGTTGLQKMQILEAVADITLKEKFQLGTGLAHEDAKRHLKIFDIDKRISDHSIVGYTSIMDSDDPESRTDVWKKELKGILTEIETDKTEHVFLSMHGVYYRYNNYFSMIDMDLLAKFQPTIIITLIDDIYDVSDKVIKKEKQLSTNSSCTISEALGWRTIEILMGDNISQNLYKDPESLGISSEKIDAADNEIQKLFRKAIPHFVLAIKHPVRTFYRLLFEKNRLRLYASFPITSTRIDKNSIDEINDFKAKLEKDYTVLDPATIDEYIIKKDFSAAQKELWENNGIIVKEDEEWILLKRLHGNFSRTTELPEGLEIKNIVDLEEPITKHIEKRDYRMVSQSVEVVAYRPFWGGRPDPSGGVDAELKYALTQHKGILAFHPEGDGDPNTLFRGFETAIKKKSLDEIFEHLKTQQEGIQNEGDTWE